MAAKPRASEPRSFASPGKFRAWLAKHHATARELDVRLFRVHAAHRGIGYAAALDEALCFGWIDGVRRALDADSFRVRFTPRRPGSRWSLVNVAHVRRLIASGRMRSPGRRAFEARDPDDARRYSFETRSVRLAPALARKLRAAGRAWDYFASRPPGYRRTAIYWVMNAKQQATRERRLDELIERSARGLPIRVLERSRPRTGERKPRGTASVRRRIRK